MSISVWGQKEAATLKTLGMCLTNPSFSKHFSLALPAHLTVPRWGGVGCCLKPLLEEIPTAGKAASFGNPSKCGQTLQPSLTGSFQQKTSPVPFNECFCSKPLPHPTSVPQDYVSRSSCLGLKVSSRPSPLPLFCTLHFLAPNNQSTPSFQVFASSFPTPLRRLKIIIMTVSSRRMRDLNLPSI